MTNFFKKIFGPFARISLFIIFFWFGALKLFGLSPATPLVQELFAKTIPFMPFSTFIILFGLFEMLIGILFLIRGLEKVAITLLFIHMATTFMPLFMVPSETWTGFLAPSMEGQYIIKNLVIIATAIGIIANLRPRQMKSEPY